MTHRSGCSRLLLLPRRQPGNRRAQVFHDEADYQGFVPVTGRAYAGVGMRLPAFCLMANHIHFALWPEHDADLAACMHWLLTTHVARYRNA